MILMKIVPSTFSLPIMYNAKLLYLDMKVSLCLGTWMHSSLCYVGLYSSFIWECAMDWALAIQPKACVVRCCFLILFL